MKAAHCHGLARRRISSSEGGGTLGGSGSVVGAMVGDGIVSSAAGGAVGAGWLVSLPQAARKTTIRVNRITKRR